MNERLEDCFLQIEKVRQVAAGAEVAYVARSRLGRLILALSSLACTLAGVRSPDRPMMISVPDNCSASLKLLAAGCNRLVQISKTITQPSEPMDERWRSGWAALLANLANVEGTLVVIRKEMI